MSHAKNCRLETVGHAGYVHVQRCLDCGCVSIHVGPVTIRVDRAGLVMLARACTDAIDVLESPLDAPRVPTTARGSA
jgi:hypothetical protein